MKACPLLEKYGVDVNERGYKIQWVIDICLECPLGERCVFDSPGKVTKADRKALLEYYEEKLHQKGKPEAESGTGSEEKD